MENEPSFPHLPERGRPGAGGSALQAGSGDAVNVVRVKGGGALRLRRGGKASNLKAAIMQGKGNEMADNPMDYLATQLQGRMMTLEILVTMLLIRDSERVALLEAADEVLATYESELSDEVTNRDRMLAMFEVARTSLYNIANRVRSHGQ